MRIAVIGTGYVGLVAGACFASLGNEVACVDIDGKKIAGLRKGLIPIFEPGLEELVKRNAGEERLSFTTDTAKAVRDSEIIFIAVGTPQGSDGEADLGHVLRAAEAIGKGMDSAKIVVGKSTVPVGTSKKIRAAIDSASGKKFSAAVVSNPEFLREGSAVQDFLGPDRVILGSESREAAEKVASLYRPLKCKILFTSPESAELIKDASNAFLATKNSFRIPVAAICEKTGADVNEVAEGIGLDTRIGRHFLNAGSGYGGSCFPKDVQALQKTARELGYDFVLLRGTELINSAQKTIVVQKLSKELGSFAGKKIVLLGLAFKPNTDDMREAPSIEVIRLLEEEGAIVVAVDPAAAENAKKIFPKLNVSVDAYSAARGADAIALLTEWNEFLELDYGKIGRGMNQKTIVDGRNCLDREKMVSLGFRYVGVGR